MKLTEILFPTDFSPASEAAGRIAREMALQTGARLHLVHVVPPVTDPGPPAESLTRAARALGDGLRVETALLSGLAGRNIVDYARDKGIDLIVVGTHGRTGISHAILGSVAETVVRLAPCLGPGGAERGGRRGADRRRPARPAAVPGLRGPERGADLRGVPDAHPG
jgi:nucleotide-binding universal stress UspA family protein